MQKGDIVIIISQCQTTGYEGTVTKVYPNLYGNQMEYIAVNLPALHIERIYNSRSVEIKTSKKGEVKMNNKFNDCTSIVGVNFLQGYNTAKEYAFACYDKEVSAGDLVVCDTANGISVARVCTVYEKENYPSNVVGKEIICKIDIAAFEERKAVRARKQELKAKMDKRVKQLQDTAIYETLAKDDEELAELLAEFKNIK